MISLAHGMGILDNRKQSFVFWVLPAVCLAGFAIIVLMKVNFVNLSVCEHAFEVKIKLAPFFSL